MSRKITFAEFGIYLLLWVILTFFLLYLIYDFNTPFLQQFLSTLVVTGFTAFPAYLSSKVLVPKLLYRKLIRKFVGALLLTAFVNTVLTYFIGGAIYYELSGKSIFLNIAGIQAIFATFYLINFIVIVICCAIHIIYNHFWSELLIP